MYGKNENGRLILTGRLKEHFIDFKQAKWAVDGLKKVLGHNIKKGRKNRLL